MLSKIDQMQAALQLLRVDYWVQHEFLTIQWLFGVLMIIIPWIIWWNLVDKRYLCGLFGFAMTVAYVVTLFDGVGTDLALWSYPIHVTPYNRFLCVDTSILPVFYALLFQYFPKWKSFVIATAVLALFASFVAEPFYVWIGMYHLIHWHYIYSFPIYIVIGVVVKWFFWRFRKYKQSHSTV